MARIAGVNVPSEKPLKIALRYIFGVGPKIAQEICTKTGFSSEKRVHQFTDDELVKISTVIDRDYTIEGDLRRKVSLNIKALMDMGCYVGLRHRRKLPVHGQSTHTNARTRKGKAKPIANKKK